MECACDINVDHDGGPSMYTEKIVKAKQDHRCYECLKDIKSGERYEHVRGMWDGSFSTYKTCLDCVSLRKQFFSTWIYTQLWDDFDNYLDESNGELPEKCIAALTPMAREKVCEKIEMYWEYLDS